MEKGASLWGHMQDLHVVCQEGFLEHVGAESPVGEFFLWKLYP